MIGLITMRRAHFGVWRLSHQGEGGGSARTWEFVMSIIHAPLRGSVPWSYIGPFWGGRLVVKKGRLLMSTSIPSRHQRSQANGLLQTILYFSYCILWSSLVAIVSLVLLTFPRLGKDFSWEISVLDFHFALGCRSLVQCVWTKTQLDKH